MVRFFIALLFIYNLQVLSGSGEKTLLASSQTRDENSETVSPDSDNEMDKCAIVSKKNCSDLHFQCMKCDDYTSNCTYGDYNTINCYVPHRIPCLGEHRFQKIARCQYCYQTEKWEHICDLKHQCTAVASPPQYYKTNCTVHGNIFCLGQRKFPKKLRCNWTRGHKWSTALILSITLGGFGADRFYLGHWQEGIGKLFSFGGLGVWTLVDVLLIAIRYLGPADGSFYV